ncbi:MAG: hypothetical protein ACM3NQ_14365 [Bacteroidales bacterium]
MMKATGDQPTGEQIEDERRRARRVRLIVDFTCALIAQTRPQRADAEQMVQAARLRILELFPGREETYEIVCAPRFRRILEEFTRPDAEPPRPEPPRGVVIRFRAKTSVH